MADLAGLPKKIASDLMADLKSGKLLKVGIDEVRAAIAKETVGERLDFEVADRLEKSTLRALISSV